jgi:type VI secretion system secreted protein VgrG
MGWRRRILGSVGGGGSWHARCSSCSAMSDLPLPALPTRGLRLVTPLSENLDVREVTIDDGLSSLFTVDLQVLSDNPAIDLEALVGQQASFEIELDPIAYPETPKRTWSGVVSEVHLLRSESAGLSSYSLTIAPNLWLLTRRTNCRVFQQMSDLDVAKAILAEWDIEPIVECSRTQKTRKYRVQYQETDHAFFSRLLEASGVTYSFRTEDGVSRVVLSDAPERGRERSAAIEYSDEPETMDVYATNFRASRALVAGRIAVADHDHRLANMPLVAQTAASAHPTEARLEHFVYEPGSFRFGNDGPKDTPTADDRGRTRTDLDEGQRIADQKGSASMARARRYVFESNALDLVPGLSVKLNRNPAAERVGSILVTRTVITGTNESTVHIQVHGAAASAPYRPDAITPIPIIHGVESAVVVGPAGETIHCDEFGRVRIQFHWDRYGNMDENSSCWVPVNQMWAGEGLGSLNLPRIGQEVMVSFLAGNPEEPMVVGRMFTNLLRPPFALPANKTQNGFRSASVPATGGYNLFMFEDKAGSEEIRVRAEKDMNSRINNDTTTSIGRHRKTNVEGNDKEIVEGTQKEGVIGDKLGQVLGNLMQMTNGQRILATVKDFVSSALSHRISSEVGTTITVGQSMIHISPDSIVIQTPKLFLNPGEKVARDAALTGKTPNPES